MRLDHLSALCSFGLFSVFVSLFGSASYQERNRIDQDADLKIEHAKYLAKAEEQRVLNNLISRLIQTQRYMRDFSETAGLLELSEDQIKDLEQLKIKYSELLEENYSHLPGADQADFNKMRLSKEFLALSVAEREEVESLQRDMMLALTEILVANQLDSLSKMDIREGLPKMLIESPIGKMIELSDEQRSRIVKESNRLSDEISEFSTKVRKEGRSIIVNNLSDEQLSKLRKIVGETFMDRYPGGYPIEILGAASRFKAEEE